MSEDAIKKVKRICGKAKSQLTCAHNWIKAFNAENQQIEGVEVRLIAIEKAWSDFVRTQDKLEDLDPEAEKDGEQEAFEAEYYAACAKAKTFIAAHKRNEQNQNIVVANNIAQNEQTRNAGNSISQIKLPPIDLPTFEGSYDEWPSFRDTFKAVIDENTDLSDIKKLYYLRLALKGIAAEVIASITMSADNYRTAWNLLEGRFENKRVLVHHHIQTLLDIPEIQKESHSPLRLLLDTTEKHVRSLKKLDQPTDQWSTILVHLLTAKLESTTKRAWENKTSSKEVATYEQFIEFLTNRCIMLETLQLDNSKAGKANIHGSQSKVNTSKRAISAVVTEARTNKCAICKEGNHQIYYCPTFLNLPSQTRIKEVQKLKVCVNCFKGGHKLEACVYGTCRLCTKKHNTLLHCNKQSDASKSDNAAHSKDSPENLQPSAITQTLTHCAMRTQEKGLLATAIIKIQNSKGESCECRAFLDPGSQTNFITHELCKQLHLSQHKNYLPICGIHGTQTTALTETQATIMSKFNSFKVKLNFSVLPEITANLPLSKIDIDKLKIPDTISLADPLFHIPKRIDILLGSAIFWDLLCVGQINFGKNQTVAQKTKLGWIIAGPIGFENYVKPTMVHTSILPLTETIENQLQQFWHIEEGAPFTEPSVNDRICEEDFVQTHRRNLEGRFKVRLPFQGDIKQLGSLKDIAIKRLKAIERKLARSHELKEQYKDFMWEYQDLDHMTEVADASIHEDKLINYLPHHAVLKEDSVTTKMRVVFDASSTTSSGVALNDIIRVGPTIQQDLFHILLRFRQHRYVITADIQKMYWQILLQEDQRDLQRIVWKQDQNEPITEFRLNTLTYGLASAPFLATRCLLQLAIENQDEYPEASNVI